MNIHRYFFNGLGASLLASVVLAGNWNGRHDALLPTNIIRLETPGRSAGTQDWQPSQTGKSVEGTPLRIKETVFRQGGGTHAHSASAIDLKGVAEKFIAMVGVDGEKANSAGSLTLEAWQEVPEPLMGVKRIVCLGDSITEGGEGPGGYVWLLRHFLADLYPQQPIQVLNAGISGHKSNDMLARFQKDVLDKKPDLVTISVGVNDVWHGYYDFQKRQPIPDGNGPKGIPLDAYKKNVEAMITLALAKDIRVVLLSTTLIHENLKSPENGRLVRYNRALRDLAGRYKLTFVDYQKPFQNLVRAYRETTGARDNLLTTDGVHMNGMGNRVMAHTLLNALGISAEARAVVQGKVEKEIREGK